MSFGHSFRSSLSFHLFRFWVQDKRVFTTSASVSYITPATGQRCGSTFGREPGHSGRGRMKASRGETLPLRVGKDRSHRLGLRRARAIVPRRRGAGPGGEGNRRTPFCSGLACSHEDRCRSCDSAHVAMREFDSGQRVKRSSRRTSMLTFSFPCCQSSTSAEACASLSRCRKERL